MQKEEYALAGKCSNPQDTNVEIGKKMPTYLPVMSCAIVHRKTAMHTSQLQPMPRRKMIPQPFVVLETATLTTYSATFFSFKPHRSVKTAKPKPPTMLPSHADVITPTDLYQSAFPSMTADGVVNVAPVNRMLPCRRNNPH